jgi:Phr family secreted Rap phosphatase inhibitor
LKKIIIILCGLAVVAVVGAGWTTYQNKQRFDAVMAEYAKDQASRR